ncbi:hypothetical protein [Erythrobacter sp. Alg231-14]|uniref:hypothetical protein n=1 Tax=Erythrobacter sp. Alg231-14 TaxID=1922225 RepID=UPI00307B3F63
MRSLLKLSAIVALPMVVLTGCEEEAAPEEAVVTETGGTVSGEVLGGTISDDMIPLEELSSTSPPAERSVVTTQQRRTDGGQTTVETTIETTVEPADGTQSADQPEPPETPATPE